jgi:hypothetical protein
MNYRIGLFISLAVIVVQFFFIYNCLFNSVTHELAPIHQQREPVHRHNLAMNSTIVPSNAIAQTLKSNMSPLEWKAFVVGQLHATSNFSAAMYARWSRYLNKEWINDDFKSSTPRAIEWDNCMNGVHYCVISMAVYAHDASYLNWIRSRLPVYRDAIDVFYPGWRLRIYHDESVPFSVLESVAARGAETIFVSDFKGHIAGMFWRFFVADDLNVDRYLVRDLDSDFTWRERAAVDEWIRSNISYHSMSDCENHNVPIMGGMWGGMPKRPLPFSIRNTAPSYISMASHKGGDQDFLAHVVWPAWLESRSVFAVAMRHFTHLSLHHLSRDFVKHVTWHDCAQPWRRPFPVRLDQQDNFATSMWSHEMPWKEPHYWAWTWEPIPDICRPFNRSHWVHG